MASDVASSPAAAVDTTSEVDEERSPSTNAGNGTEADQASIEYPPALEDLSLEVNMPGELFDDLLNSNKDDPTPIDIPTETKTGKKRALETDESCVTHELRNSVDNGNNVEEPNDLHAFNDDNGLEFESSAAPDAVDKSSSETSVAANAIEKPVAASAIEEPVAASAIEKPVATIATGTSTAEPSSKKRRIDDDTEHTAYFSYSARPNFDLSCMRLGMFRVEGREFVSVENYYQWRRLQLAASHAITKSFKTDILAAAEAVRKSKSPKQCDVQTNAYIKQFKEEGSWPEKFDALWGPDNSRGYPEKKLVGFLKTVTMREAVRHRAFADCQLSFNTRQTLYATGTKHLIYRSFKDAFFGIGPDESNANMLGRIWEGVRAELYEAGKPAEDAEDEAYVAGMRKEQDKKAKGKAPSAIIRRKTKYGTESFGSRSRRRRV